MSKPRKIALDQVPLPGWRGKKDLGKGRVAPRCSPGLEDVLMLSDDSRLIRQLFSNHYVHANLDFYLGKVQILVQGVWGGT